MILSHQYIDAMSSPKRVKLARFGQEYGRSFPSSILVFPLKKFVRI